MLCDTQLPLSDSSCYVCAFIFEETLSSGTASFSPDPVLKQLNQEFAGEKCIFWKHDAKQLIGIFNTSSLIPFHVALRCLKSLKNAGLSLPLIGVGDTVSGLMECSYSYNRALTALTYQLYDSSSHIFTYETICSVPPKTRLSDIDYLPLFQYIVKKDRDKIKAYCDELGQYNIQVNGIAPGYYATDITLATRSNPETNQRVLDHIPANRWGDTQVIWNGGNARYSSASPAS